MGKLHTDLALDVSHLNVSIRTKTGIFQALHDLSFKIQPSERVGILGASGAGKSMLANTLAGLVQDDPIYTCTGQIRIMHNGQSIDLNQLDQQGLVAYRKNLSAIIFQDPYASLIPNKRCGQQIKDILRLHQVDHPKAQALNMIRAVGFSTDTHKVYHSYPHQLSGGECQRIVIACVLSSRARLIIADEPTSSLDAYHENLVLEHLVRAQATLGAGLILIAHDVRLIKKMTSRYIRIASGKIIKIGWSKDLQVFDRPPRGIKGHHDHQAPLLQLKNICIQYKKVGQPFFIKKNYHTVVRHFNLTLRHKAILGLVGKSGSGKSSIARAIVRMIPVCAGTIEFKGHDITDKMIYGQHTIKKDIQLVLQDSYLSFNPAYRVSEIIDQIMKYAAYTTTAERKTHLMTKLGIVPRWLKLFAHQLSGGQRQRLNLLRSLLLEPTLLICDECVASLDDQTKFEILDLLKNLNLEEGLSILFISHDLQSVSYICDSIIHL